MHRELADTEYHLRNVIDDITDRQKATTITNDEYLRLSELTAELTKLKAHIERLEITISSLACFSIELINENAYRERERSFDHHDTCVHCKPQPAAPKELPAPTSTQPSPHRRR